MLARLGRFTVRHRKAVLVCTVVFFVAAVTLRRVHQRIGLSEAPEPRAPEVPPDDRLSEPVGSR